MKRYKKITLFLSIVLALVTTFLGNQVFLNELNKRNVTNVVQVPIAKEDIPQMQKITKDHITMVDLNVKSIEKLKIIRDPNLIIGRVSKTLIETGNPFNKSQLINRDDSLPFYLKEGMRAITIPSSPVISVGGYLKPGHHVDVYWTIVEDGNTKTSLALQNIKVLAVGKPHKNPLNITGEETTITLLVSPKDAQLLTLLNNQGTTKLALRGSSTEPLLDLDSIDTQSLRNLN